MKRFEIHVSSNTVLTFRSREDFIKFITRVVPPAYRNPKRTPPN